MPLNRADPNRVDCASGEVAQAGDAMQAPGLRILVVDDNRDAADMMRLIFEAHGHSVQTAYFGLDAVEAARLALPDLVFMDLNLPDIDGREALKMIRQLPGGAQVRIVALTGWGADRVNPMMAEGAINHYFLKPVEFDALENYLKTVPRSARE